VTNHASSIAPGKSPFGGAVCTEMLSGFRTEKAHSEVGLAVMFGDNHMNNNRSFAAEGRGGIPRSSRVPPDFRCRSQRRGERQEGRRPLDWWRQTQASEGDHDHGELMRQTTVALSRRSFRRSIQFRVLAGAGLWRRHSPMPPCSVRSNAADVR